MEQRHSWEANRFSSSHEIPRSLWNLKVHYHIHKCLPPVHILSQINSIHAFTSHFLHIYHNIILPPMLGSSRWSLSLSFPNKTLYTPLLDPIQAACPAHLILLHFITWTILC
jgi:hypothetical protein